MTKSNHYLRISLESIWTEHKAVDHGALGVGHLGLGASAHCAAVLVFLVAVRTVNHTHGGITPLQI